MVFLSVMNKQKKQWIGVFWIPLIVAIAMVTMASKAQSEESGSSGKAVVIWISIDGVRPDYLERSETPFFDRMMSEGAYSLALEPVFPSLTFPNHASQATGRNVDGHGIPMNAFYDREKGREFSFPGLPELLMAEPIWTVAERQGRRTVVKDWVMSYGEFDGTAAAYHAARYDGRLEDRERIQIVLDTWRQDESDEPVQLLMGYMDHPDQIGHRFGPDGEEVEASMAKMDEHMSTFMDEALSLFRDRMSPEDSLYLLVTSDHGMSEVHTTVNPYILTGVSREESDGEQALLITSGSIAHVYFLDQGNERERLRRIRRAYRTAAQHDFVSVYRPHELPERWGYLYPNRTGDIILSLDKGYTFNRGTPGLTGAQEDVGGHIGMHGYDVADNPEMNGILLAWRYPEAIGGVNVGTTHALQLHSTIAKWLGIDPADGAHPEAVVW